MYTNKLQMQFRARNKRLKRKGLNYLEFLKSKWWLEMKEYLRKFEEFKKCQICKNEKTINLHHMSYCNIFQPSFKKRKRDIISLCQNCHYEIHKLCQLKNYGLRQGIKKYKIIWISKKY